MTHDLWAKLNEKMFEYLNSVSLAELVAQQRRPASLSLLHDERTKGRVKPAGIAVSA